MPTTQVYIFLSIHFLSVFTGFIHAIYLYRLNKPIAPEFFGMLFFALLISAGWWLILTTLNKYDKELQEQNKISCNFLAGIKPKLLSWLRIIRRKTIAKKLKRHFLHILSRV